MRDCYKILGVSKSASAAEIRRAYRQKAKLLHPDLTHSDAEIEAFRELTEAYEVLSNEHSRSLFDSEEYYRENFNFNEKKHKSFDYRSWLLERGDDESMSKLILFDLLHHREDEAVARYKEMNMTRTGFKLSRWFTREDFMDYGFILTEELVLRQEYYDAAILISQVILMNYSYDYFKFFIEDVKDFARHIFKNNIEYKVSDELALDAWERALELELSREDDAFFLRKMADAYDRLGDSTTAKICRDESIRLAG